MFNRRTLAFFCGFPDRVHDFGRAAPHHDIQGGNGWRFIYFLLLLTAEYIIITRIGTGKVGTVSGTKSLYISQGIWKRRTLCLMLGMNGRRKKEGANRKCHAMALDVCLCHWSRGLAAVTMGAMPVDVCFTKCTNKPDCTVV
jgi:hypothetical protein